MSLDACTDRPPVPHNAVRIPNHATLRTDHPPCRTWADPKLFDTWRFHAFSRHHRPGRPGHGRCGQGSPRPRDHRAGPRRPEGFRARAPAVGSVRRHSAWLVLAVMAFNLTRARRHPHRHTASQSDDRHHPVDPDLGAGGSPCTCRGTGLGNRNGITSSPTPGDENPRPPSPPGHPATTRNQRTNRHPGRTITHTPAAHQRPQPDSPHNSMPIGGSRLRKG